MIELPYVKKFFGVPNIDKQELADYFNTELGLGAEVYYINDFEYLGIFEIDGYERMFWKVRGKDICATVRPYEDTYFIEMDSGPDVLSK
jgi:hypothetical protein